MHLKKDFFISVVPDAQWIGPDLPCDINLVVDSRLCSPGDYFVALKGEHHDGNDFVADALARGAQGLLVSSMPEETPAGVTVIVVKDTLATIVAVAKAWRAQMFFPLVGITGSVGKTSTKQLLGEILKNAKKDVLVAQGNQNTVLGVSLNIWRLRKDHDCALFEMGISKKGEMQRMADIVRPTLGIITYIGHSHMEGLGSRDDIAVEKRGVFTYFNERYIGIIQGDQPELSALSYNHPIIKFGTKMTHQVQVRKVVVHQDSITCVLKIYQERLPLVVPTTNTAFLNCILAASSAAYILGIDSKHIIETVQKPLVIAGRYEKRLLPLNRGTVINDAYNASPESMKAALLAFEKTHATYKVAVLGDMLELGHLSDFWHRQIGRFLKKIPSLTHLILVGSHVAELQKTAPLGLSCILVPTWKDAVAPLSLLLGPDTVVLFKASRGIALNNVIDILEKNT